MIYRATIKNTIKILYWNINGVKDKCEENRYLKFFGEYDLIFLSELKCRLRLKVPGFETYRAQHIKGASHRGGLAVLIKPHLIPFVKSINQSIIDQICLEISIVPNTIIGGVYIPPPDSKYFDLGYWTDLQACLLEGNHEKHIFLGDVNAHINLATELKDDQFDYTESKDKTDRNTNSTQLLNICSETESKIINNCIYNNEIHHKGDLTYKKGSSWISELDYAVISKNLIHDVNNFGIIKNDLKSGHAPITITLRVDECEYIVDRLVQKSSSFMDYHHFEEQTRTRKFRAASTDKISFIQSMGNPTTTDTVNCENSLTYVNETINRCAATSQLNTQNKQCNNREAIHHNRWLNIPLKDIWQSIGWNGLLENKTFNNQDQPKPYDFKRHYEALLNIPGETELLEDFSYDDVLVKTETDREIEYNEIEDAVNNMNDKSSGPDGVPPGLLKYLPDQWLLLILNLLNTIFLSGGFPICWIYSTLASIYKSGSRKDCRNYRGICMIDAILKVYDKILVARLTKWWKPDIEQIGNQPERSCIDHILTLHILINIARTSKKKLFILYVDFSKAYDRVSRPKLLTLLKKAGCGRFMLRAILAMYKTTKILCENTTISTNSGVKQGSPSSGFLFTFFINPLVKLLKQLGTDDYLDDLHCLLMMDDSIIFATTREKLEGKVEILVQNFDKEELWDFDKDIRERKQELKTKYMLYINLYMNTLGTKVMRSA